LAKIEENPLNLNISKKMSATLKAPCGRVSVTKSRCRNVRVTAIAEVLEKGSNGPKPDVPSGLNKFSSRITQPKSQGASQAMLYATGLNENDMNKPQVR
jgi:dihydroxy-acid dehydratase